MKILIAAYSHARTRPKRDTTYTICTYTPLNPSKLGRPASGRSLRTPSRAPRPLPHHPHPLPHTQPAWCTRMTSCAVG